MDELKRTDNLLTTNVKLSLQDKYLSEWQRLTHGAKTAIVSALIDECFRLTVEENVPIIPYILAGRKQWILTLNT